jgi:hypothetical protein
LLYHLLRTSGLSCNQFNIAICCSILICFNYFKITIF